MAKKIVYSILFCLLSSFIFAQTNPAETKLEKIYALIDKNKIKPAEEQLEDLLEKYPSFGKAWDLLAKIKYYNYEQSKKLPNIFQGNISVTTTDEDGNKVEAEDDSLASSLMNLLSTMNPSTAAYNEWLMTLKKATLFSNTAYGASINLRNAVRPVEVDTLVNSKALKYFNQAEEEFKNKNYNKAAGLYQRAIDNQPDFYKASLYLGDAFFYAGNYVDAIKYFKKCSDKYPTFLEPRKYLVDAYYKEGLHQKALDEAIKSTMTYPDLSINVKLEDIVYVMGNKTLVEWQPRGLLPNVIKIDTNELVFTEDEKTATPKEPWNFYKNALDKIAQFCNNKGQIIKTTTLTTSNYLEVYSWEEMLNNSSDDELKQAKEMQAKGYLDCYVLITCFHEDIYDQYHHFIANNRDKVLDYYRNVVISQ